jgi:hypothetical protein
VQLHKTEWRLGKCKFIELTKSNDYFNEKRWNKTNIGCSKLSTNNEG